MHAVSVPPGPHVPRKIASGIAAVILLCGCATGPVPGRTASACRVDSVLYCEVDVQLDMQKCQCVRRTQLRDMMQSLARR